MNFAAAGHALGRQSRASSRTWCGTPYFPHVEGGILFLEDVGEHPYRVERMLYQLLHAGVLARQRAILLGQFTEYRANGNDGGYDLDDGRLRSFARSSRYRSTPGCRSATSPTS